MAHDLSFELSPAQRAALDALLAVAKPGRVGVLVAGPGNGKSSILREARASLGGTILGTTEIQAAAAGRHPLAIEDAFYDLVRDALASHDVVFVDDADLVMQVTEGCHAYPRSGYLMVGLTALADLVARQERTLVFAASHLNGSLWRLGGAVTMHDLAVDDYTTIAGAHLGPEQRDAIDFGKVHRFARKMTARQLHRACIAVAPLIDTSDRQEATDRFIDYLRSAQLVSNVDLGEVQDVALDDLKGLDDVIRALEANVIMPLEHGELATELSLKPKRGVLLAGPPGTGKTTIGRALAHRLRGKFFLVDGTVIAGTPGFYSQLHQVFDAAMRNAPAVVFIDDSDVIFEGQDPGLYRYLLTMLDGLESESAGGVCLVLTAMDVGSLPPALVRSGRIELWLETRLPDVEAREAILRDRVADLPASIGVVDVASLARATEQLSGADLKRVIEDGKLLYAYDRARGESPRGSLEYFLEALDTVRANKVRYAEAEASARARNPARPSYFNLPFLGAADMAESMQFVHMAQVDGAGG